MKFIDTKSREHKIDIRPSRWKRKEVGQGRGKYQSMVGEILSEVFRGNHVLEEFPCKGEGLFLDFFIPNKLIAVEVQGQQHNKFNLYFHGTMANFIAQRKRDERKAEWCEINRIRLIKINYGLSEDEIRAALDEEIKALYHLD